MRTSKKIFKQKEDGGYELCTPNSERAVDKAKAEGLTIVYAKANELFIDIDTDADYAVFQDHFATISSHYRTVGHPVVKPSKSGGERRHITVTLCNNITHTERILLQAVLGSDRKRELLSWLEELNGDATPVLFLEKAQKQLGAGVAVALLTEGQ